MSVNKTMQLLLLESHLFNVSGHKNDNTTKLLYEFGRFLCNIQSLLLNYSAEINASFYRGFGETYGHEATDIEVKSSKIAEMVENGDTVADFRKRLRLFQKLPILSNSHLLQNKSTFSVVSPYRCKGSHFVY